MKYSTKTRSGHQRGHRKKPRKILFYKGFVHLFVVPPEKGIISFLHTIKKSGTAKINCPAHLIIDKRISAFFFSSYF